MSDNNNLNSAKQSKNDEFYTQIKDIDEELKHYEEHLVGKSIFLNCDDPDKSEFWRYFKERFDVFSLSKLVAIYLGEEIAHKTEMYSQTNIIKTPLSGNGDFRSEESIEVLKEVDLVITNPPFSLFREYIDLMVKHDKKFLVLGNQNATTYKEIFPLIMGEKLWLGVNNGSKTYKLGMTNKDDFPSNAFYIEGEPYAKLGNTSWFTNLYAGKRVELLQLQNKYDPDTYPRYDNYNAIEVSKVSEIPKDYTGIMGVPVTYLTKHNPTQFEIVGCSYRYGDEAVRIDGINVHGANLGGKEKYRRLFIKKK